jgi:hypothetical protein
MDTKSDRVNPIERVAYAFVGLSSGDAMLRLYLLISWSPQPEMVTLVIFAMFSFVGWLCVGLPIALVLPTRSITHLSWPLALVVGVVVGPVALLGAMLGIFLTSYVCPIGFVSGMPGYMISKVEPYAFSILISTVSFGVYVALLRTQTRGRHNQVT